MLSIMDLFPRASGKHVRAIYTPLHPTIVKLGFTGYRFFLIFALKHRLWVLVRTASLTCTHNLRFEQKYENSKNISTENCHFYSRKILLYIAWECLRNVQG